MGNFVYDPSKERWVYDHLLPSREKTLVLSLETLKLLDLVLENLQNAKPSQNVHKPTNNG